MTITHHTFSDISVTVTVTSTAAASAAAATAAMCVCTASVWLDVVTVDQVRIQSSSVSRKNHLASNVADEWLACHVPPTSIWGGIIKWGAVSVPLSVCVCCVPRPNSRMERLRKPKIGTMKAHHTSNQWTCLEVKSSKVKVSRPINAVTESVPYLSHEKAYELENWQANWAWKFVSSTSAITSKV